MWFPIPTLAIAALLARGAVAQLPKQPTGLKTIKAPGGVQIRYKEPTLCRTTPGAKAYSGYVDLDADTHYYFTFYESRRSPKDDPITLWLTGGPGSDTKLAELLEHGPCLVTTSDLEPAFNPHSWNSVSNMLYLSQPLGVGFSYSTQAAGSLDDNGNFLPSSVNGTKGRYPIVDSTIIDTSQKAAVSAWSVIQAFYSALPQLDSNVKSKSFHLWTESYGGHYGPAFYDYFVNQSEAIKHGNAKGIELSFDSLGLGNPMVDYKIQVPYFLDFATNNTYGIVAFNETILDHGKFNLNRPSGCLDFIDFCHSTKGDSLIDQSICAEAQVNCADNVEGLYYALSNNNAFDIRVNASVDFPNVAFLTKYLNQAKVQEDFGVSLNWTSFAPNVFYAFQNTADELSPALIHDIADLLDKGVRVNIYAGDADYACNWLGVEAVTLAIPYSQQQKFHAAGYASFVLNDKDMGAVRQYGNLSFMRVYNSGHQVPSFQPEVALALFNRTLAGVDIATGKARLTSTYSTKGNATSTFREA